MNYDYLLVAALPDAMMSEAFGVLYVVFGHFL